MLNTYLAQVQQLLQNPSAPAALYSTANLTTWINTARGQIAGEAECIRVYASLPLTTGTRQYPFSAVNLNNAPGVSGVTNIRTMWYPVGSGQLWITPRSFEWFSLYHLSNPVPPSGPPTTWAQFAQGTGGSLFIDPLPDQAYTLNLDTVCYPINLALDTDPEAIPEYWQDAVQFLAAFFALLSAQAGARQNDADRMWKRYKEFMTRARQFATPSLLPGQNEQVPDITRPDQLGGQQITFNPGQGGGGGGGAV